MSKKKPGPFDDAVSILKNSGVPSALRAARVLRACGSIEPERDGSISIFGDSQATAAYPDDRLCKAILSARRLADRVTK
jgi:hypothetical protein